MSQSTKKEKLKFLDAARENTGRVGKKHRGSFSDYKREMRDKASSEVRKASFTVMLYCKTHCGFRTQGDDVEKGMIKYRPSCISLTFLILSLSE